MRKRILHNMLAQIACTAFVFTLISVIVLVNVFSKQSARELERSLIFISTGVERDEDPISFLKSLKEGGMSERLTLIAADGTVLYDSEGDPKSMDNHLSRAEIQAASQSAVGVSLRFSPTLRSQTRYYALKLSDGSYLRLSDTRSGILDWMLGLSGWFVTALIFVCAGAAALSLHITRKIVQPINALNLDLPDESSVYPEIQPLVRRMIQQNHSIQEYIRALKARKLEFEAITAQMEEGLILLNPKGEVVFINHSASALFKAPDAEGCSMLSLCDEPAFTEAFHTALGGRHTDVVLRLDDRYQRLHIHPVSDSGHFTGFMALIVDISEQVLAEQNRREFTANVSHELKTPLTSIVGYSEIIKSGIADEKDWQSLVSHIYDEASRMMRLVEDILHLSRLDSGELHGNAETIELLGLVREIARRFDVAAEKQNVAITVSGKQAYILANRHSADEIIANLIDNAVKYNREGGRVEVHVSQQHASVLLNVKDTGIGIPAEYQDRVFERFFRVDKSRSKATGGTGLGLSIVKHAVALLGGSVRMESVPNKGTDIQISFPSAPK